MQKALPAWAASALFSGLQYPLWGGRPHAFAPDLKAGDINEVRRLIEKYEMPVLGYTPEHNAYPYNYMIGSEAQRRDAVDYL